MHAVDQLARMNADELREFAARLITEIADTRREVSLKQIKIDQLTHEMAILKRWKFAARSEQLQGEQRHLFDETIEADLEAIELELTALQRADEKAIPKQQPRRAPLPAHLPRTEIRHEPESTVCACGCALKRIGEDVSEKLDYVPGVFSIERHVRGKWACTRCQTLTQASVPAHVIDKGIPTAGLLAQVLVAKYLDHQPLYRQEGIFGRAGLAIPRSTLAQWVGMCGVQLQPLADALRQALLARGVVHADETPVAMLSPGKGKTHRAYLWTYGTTEYDPLQAVVYDFADSRAGEHARRFLEGWSGTLVCDDYAGYKALFADGVTEAGCLAHARRKFHELWANHKSPVAEEALRFFGALYEIESIARELNADERQRLRQLRSRPIADTLHKWLILQRQKATDGTAIAKALDYSLKRWEALTRFIGNGALPADNNHIENRIRPIALGRSNWLFAGSLRGGQRAAAAMSLIQSAKLNGHDPYAYLKDVLERLPMHPASRIEELLPHRWATPAANG
ncbi:IS66 family transposase [Quisquiliibacterium transsilvanicum]|uniref:Transposase n=1 Tax=Quisquiliibacterium transsilvanicum TaxID=1549638 RepID=A0A7W8HKV4_9BURK|nr:IS66 family transposase [Quisquiliibacterium transsilvanicum]MBB5273946.1 transposase [Quisquiliibacterium transsilvanicum]